MYAVTSTNAYTEVDNFEVKLTARAANNRRLATKWAYGDHQDASRIDPVPFDVSVPAAGDVARYDLYYDYQYPDGRTMQDQFATVKDVCSGRYRRKAASPPS